MWRVDEKDCVFCIVVEDGRVLGWGLCHSSCVLGMMLLARAGGIITTPEDESGSEG